MNSTFDGICSSTQIERAGGDGQNVDAVDLLRITGPPGRIVGPTVPDDAGDWMRHGFREDLLIDIEPVPLDRLGLRRHEEESEIANLILAGLGAPVDDCGGEVHRLG